VIDCAKNPSSPQKKTKSCTPTLAKIPPSTTFAGSVGDLSDRERVLIGLDLLFDELFEQDLIDNSLQRP